jgi:hypothetical protein
MSQRIVYFSEIHLIFLTYELRGSRISLRPIPKPELPITPYEAESDALLRTESPEGRGSLEFLM